MSAIASWLKQEVLDRLPNLRRAFDMSRDPLIARQLMDEGKTEAERRRESTEQGEGEKSWFIEAPKHGVTGSQMVKSDKPRPKPTPPKSTRYEVDKAAFEGKWVEEQWRAIRTRIVEPENTNGTTPEHEPQTRQPPEPSQ